MHGLVDGLVRMAHAWEGLRGLGGVSVQWSHGRPTITLDPKEALQTLSWGSEGSGIGVGSLLPDATGHYETEVLQLTADDGPADWDFARVYVPSP